MPGQAFRGLPIRLSVHAHFMVLCLAASIVLLSGHGHAAETGRRQGAESAIDSLYAQDSTLQGHVVYLDFWASWCLPCRKSFPWMGGLAEKYREAGLRVVAVNLDKDIKGAEKFLTTHQPEFTILYNPTGTLARTCELEVMPSSFLYDRSGRLKQTFLGFHDDDTPYVDSLIAALLKEKSSK